MTNYSSGLESQSGARSVVEIHHGKAIVPSLDVLTEGDYSRLGPDLVITSADGHSFVVRDFFAQSPAPTLATPDGHAEISGQLATRLAGPLAPAQVAQAGAGATHGEPIGTVKTTQGAVTVQHPDGTTSELKNGDLVYQGDLIISGPASGVGIVFVDGTEFSLGAGAKMVLDEMIFDPSSGDGSSKFSLLSGTFSFVSGQVAKASPDAMSVTTPVATIGIRGTSGAIDINAANQDGNLKIILIPDPSGTVGEIHITTPEGKVFSLNSPMNGFAVGGGVSQAFTLSAHDFQQQFGFSFSFLASHESMVSHINQMAPSESHYQTPDSLDAPPDDQPQPDSQDGADAGDDMQDSGDSIRVTDHNVLDESEDLFGFDGTDTLDGSDGEDQGDDLESDDGDFSYGDGFDDGEADDQDNSGDDDLWGDDDLGEDTDYGDGTDGGDGDGDGGNGGGTGSVIRVTVTGSSPYTAPRGEASYYVQGDALNNTIITYLGNDTLIGGDGNDYLQSNDGNDVVIGGNGQDTIVGGSGRGNDVYYGGDQTSDDSTGDTLIYTSAMQNISVTLQGASGLSLPYGIAFGDDIGTDALYGIEHVIAGAGDDALTGNGADNSLSGGDGDDWLDGGMGNDVLNGGAGDDTASYASSSSGGITVTWGAVGAPVTVEDQFGDTDTLISIETIVGTSFADIYQDGIGDQVLNAGAGNDTYIWSGLGTDTIIDQAGEQDMLSLEKINTDSGLTLAHDGDENLVFTYASGGTLTIAANSRIETLKDEFNTVFNLVQGDSGSNGNDVIVAYNDGQTLYGFGGDDVLFGGDGNDTLYAGADSGGSTDTSDDVLEGQGGDDTLYGNAGRNNLRGGSGDDLLFGNAGNDSLDSGDGDDTLYGGAGSDSLNGGSGSDTVSYQESGSQGIVVNFSLRNANGDLSVTDQFGSVDVLRSIETILGSSLSDTFTSGSSNDRLMAGAGDDTYIWTGQADNIISDSSGSGDVLSLQSVGLGKLTSLGHDASGNLVVSYNNSKTLTVLAGQGVEYIRDASGDYGLIEEASSTVDGDGDENCLIGYGSGQTLNGLGGADIIYGGSGDDVIYGGISGTLGSDQENLHGGAGNDHVYGGLANDTLFGDAGDDSLFGEGGDDILYDGSGNDALYGGAGNDTYIWSGAGTDTIYNTAGNDVIDLRSLDASKGLSFLGGGSANLIIAYDGSNRLTWTATVGQEVPKSIIYPSGETRMLFAGSGSLLVGDSGNNIIYSSNNNVSVVQTIAGMAGTDMLYGSDYSDVLYADDTIIGSTATDNDHLYGGSGNDALYGNAGHNRLEGGSGSDILQGGAGDDTYVINGSTFGADTLYDTAGNDSIDASGIGVGLFLAEVTSGDLILRFDNTSTNLLTVQSYASSTLTKMLLSSGAYSLRVDSSSAANDLMIVNDTLTSSWDAGAGNDIVMMASNSGGASVMLGDGNDHLYSNPNITINFTSIDGGAGYDTFHAMMANQDYSSVTFQGIEEFSLDASVSSVLTNWQAANEATAFRVATSGAARWEIQGGSGALDLSDVTFHTSSASEFHTEIRDDNNIIASDTITGSSQRDIISLFGGNDTVQSGDGNDTIRIRSDLTIMQQVTVDGGAGTADTLSFEDVSHGLTLSYSGAHAGTVTDGAAPDAMVTFSNIERIVGSAGSDNITGSTGSDIFDGYTGSDILTGNGGADIFAYASYSSLSGVDPGSPDTITDWGSDDAFLLSYFNNSNVIFDAWADPATASGLRYLESSGVTIGATAQDLGIANGAASVTGGGVYVYNTGSDSQVWYTSDMGNASTANSYQLAVLQGTNLSQIGASNFINENGL